MPNHIQRKSLRNDTKAISPAISTVIVTSAITVMILVAMVYAQGFLDVRMAENEFNTNKQFMLTTSLQTDDIAWTIGRTQTLRYSATHGHLAFKNTTLTYTFEILPKDSVTWQTIFTYDTGVILFNMPTSDYTLGNNYLERIFPSSNGSLLQEGPTAPTSHVYVVEKLPMDTGSYTRVVVAPSVRMVNAAIGDKNYVKFYLPLLNSGTNLYLSSSVTLVGNNVTQYLHKDVEQIRITVAFPRMDEGFDSDFFRFENELSFGKYEVTEILPSASVIQFYVGDVSVSLGLHV